MTQKPVILGVAPYPILPANTGGRLGIVGMYNAMGKMCECHVISTANNGSADGYSFHLHRELSARPLRYLPGYSVKAIGALARKIGATHLFCDHPFLAPAVYHVAWEWGVPWFMRAHNIERERFRQIGKPWWPVMGLFERKWMRRANGTFFVAPEDRDWAVAHNYLKPEVAYVAPFGIYWNTAPHDKLRARQWIAAEHGIDPNPYWLYFLGALNYQPNLDAIRFIIHEVLPRLRKTNLNFQILIGGKGLPEDVLMELNAAGAGITYLGFVENLDYLLKACDVMLNPLLTGGGIKTKAIEALGYDKIVVSSESGAAGIIRNVSSPNLLIAKDGDWDEFARLVEQATEISPAIPDAFFEHYYWGNIAKTVLDTMKVKY